jgi:hypothetical protein
VRDTHIRALSLNLLFELHDRRQQHNLKIKTGYVDGKQHHRRVERLSGQAR